MHTDRSLLITACLLAAFTVGCSSVRQQFRQAFQEMKADAAVLDSSDDGLDAFGSADAKHLRAARAEMER
jgi:hypothetical protein